MKLFHIKIIGVIFSLVLFSSCQDDESKQTKQNSQGNEDINDTVKAQKLPADVDSVVVDTSLQNPDEQIKSGIVYKKDKIVLDNITFPKFPHPAIPGIMAGMNMCQMNNDSTVKEGLKLPPCDHNLYRAFKIKKDAKWTDGFILEVKASVYTYTRLVIVIRKVQGKYTAVNQFSGKLIELNLEKNGVYSMLIGYADASVGSVAIRHEFDKNKYVPTEVEEINNRFVKEQYKDSLYEVYIKDFAWGY